MKILLCDDHPVVRNGLKNILSRLDDMDHVSEAHDAKEAFEQLKTYSFDIVVLDLSFLDIDGIMMVSKIRANYPLTRILVLTMHPMEMFAVAAIKAGALCYLTKDVETTELIRAIRAVAKGEQYIVPEVGDLFARLAKGGKGLARHLSLSTLEYETMIKTGVGKSISEIASETNSNYKTVSNALHSMMNKMGFEKKSEITPYCIKNKLLELD
jgi:DNA-binding NarL/FixJ family response regulator